MKKIFVLMFLFSLTAIAVAQKHTESEYDHGVVIIDKDFDRVNKQVSDTAYESHTLFVKTRNWIKHNYFTKVIWSPDEKMIKADNDYFSLTFIFDYRDTGKFQFVFADKGSAGNAPFGTYNKQRIIDDLTQYLHASNQVVTPPDAK